MAEHSFLESVAPSPRQKAVTISDEPETITPQLTKVESPPVARQHRAGMSGKRLTGRPAANVSSSSVHSLSSQVSHLNLDNSQDDPHQSQEHDSLLSQVAKWLHEERTRRKSRKAQSRQNDGSSEAQQTQRFRSRSDSQESDTGLALDRLERVLAGYASAGKEGLAALGLGHAKHPLLKKRSHSRKMKRGSSMASSDTEYHDGDILVPNVEAVLDNSKTMSYSGGLADSDDNPHAISDKKAREKQHWVTFKQDIVRLTHTLRLKGWRRIPIENGGDIDVERLSGALTNAVYVVSPPSETPSATSSKADSSSAVSRRQPKKLLLRVYGPQVEHLIDRDSELAILRRLSRKRIGPRLLGTFTNGRFEEFFHARTLTPEDLRDPNTSTHIAKRMRELHEGIELLEEERDAGPFVFKNWDSWVDRCERIITWLDKQIKDNASASDDKQPAWKSRGLVLGVEWSVFRRTVEAARKYLYDQYGGPAGVREKLVFAHNDTQYGNLLRLTPSGESPLLLPANSHRQLVVIDFEYASANPPAIEFANHFTEWSYNYHHPTQPHICNTRIYPTPVEQHRFLRAYFEHYPQFHGSSTSTTPKVQSVTSPGIGGASSISAFMLDSRAPPGSYPFPSNYDAEEKARDEQSEKEVQQMMYETRLWRMANSAQWVAWGIVQAKMPEEFESTEKGSKASKSDSDSDADDIAMSDPLDPEVRQLREDARNDRPEGRRQENEHREGELKTVTTDSLTQTPQTPNSNGVMSEDLNVTSQDYGNEQDQNPQSEAVNALLRLGSREGEKLAAAEVSSRSSNSKDDTITGSESSPPKGEAEGATTTSVAETEQKASEDDGEGEDSEESAEFDYLAYAQDRALFFWGDALQFGIIKEDELPSELVERAKRVDY